MMDRALDWLLPACRCLSCGEPRRIKKGEALCANCWQKLAACLIDERFACPQCKGQKPAGAPCPHCLSGGMVGLQSARAPFVYKGVARRLIHLTKFGPVDLAAVPLAQAMGRTLPGLSVDAMVPVPIDQKRLGQRGMNQARLLCNLIAKEKPWPVWDALARTRHTRSQSGLSAQDRRLNVKDAFKVVMPVMGKTLLLVDDVRTTGSTAQACAQALLAAGADSVHLLTAAVAWENENENR